MVSQGAIERKLKRGRSLNPFKDVEKALNEPTTTTTRPTPVKTTSLTSAKGTSREALMDLMRRRNIESKSRFPKPASTNKGRTPRGR